MAKKPYEERIFAAFNVMVLLVIIALLLYIVFFVEAPGILGFLPFSLLLLFLLLIALYHFQKLDIRVENWGLDVGYGMLRQRIPWEYIEAASVDEKRAVTPGISLRNNGNRWRLAYYVPGFRRVSVKVRNNWYGEFAFSARNPEELTEIIQKRLKRKSKKKGQ